MKTFLCKAIALLYCFFGISQQNTQFVEIPPKDSGVYFNNKIKDDNKKNILLYANFYGGAGVGVGDFNNDGLEDLYFAGNLVDDKLYLNKGDFVFEDATLKSGIINDNSWSTGVTVADINNDGLLDIYISKELYDHSPKQRKNKLYINQGHAVFKDMAEGYGVANTERTRHATFFDYDNDGFLDLFILNQPPNPGSYSEYFGTNLLQKKYTSKLYKNKNGKAFIDVTKSAGVEKPGFPNAVSASDFNNDGWVDLYISNDFYAPDVLYLNNQDGTFTNVANTALNHMSYYSMGVDVADINNDNFLDIFVVDMVAEDNFRLKSNMSGMNPDSFWKIVKQGGHYQYMFNNFHLNNGNTTFSDIAQLTNTAATDWSWSNLIADFDNDGKKDIFIANGLLRDIRNTDASKAVGDFVVETANNWVKNNPNGGDISIWDILDLDKTLSLLPSVRLSNYMFKNKGNYTFAKVTSKWGLEKKSFSNGAAYADLDNDGDLDLVVNNINDNAFIYKNTSKNNFLRIHLKSKTHKPVLGSRIILESKNEKQVVELTNVRGMYSTSEQIAHFGVANKKRIEKITITWPNQTQTILRDKKVNQELDVYLEDGMPINKKHTQLKSVMTDVTNQKLSYLHQENELDDYKYQVLLPHKMSQFGPALAIGDVNNDGVKDVFVGAAVGYSSHLFLQTKSGDFKKKNTPDFENDKLTEDMDAVFIDVDADSDLDLYVVSGGNAYKKHHKNYKDRLYLNDGKGNFKKSEKKLKTSSFSGSVVVSADFDNDGDIDVFVGGRHVPREYPLPASSKILKNNNGVLEDVTDVIASELTEIGLITDAIWTDYDTDNDLDLMLVGEWSKILIFENNNGVFTKTELPSLFDTSGWWFSIEQADFDSDGDMDYVVGNLGLNYKYKTSKNHPFDVYYKDFNKDGKQDIVLGYYDYGKHFPLRGFSCSSQQIPSLKKKIKKYNLFASLDIDGVYGKNNLKAAQHYEAKTFATSFIENLGNKQFKVSKLPVQAQFSSVNDIMINDINKDGFKDIILVGNLHVSEIETPRNDAGTGVVLLGDGKNNFEYRHHSETGFFARNDAKKIKKLTDKNQELIFVANNNAALQVFSID